MTRLRLVLVAALIVGFCSQQGLAQESAVNQPDATRVVQEDKRLPIHKQDQWQFFVAPYIWISGANIQTTVAGRTSNVDVPWWDVATDLFSNVIGVMGRFEAWKGRWGLYVDSYYIYLGGTVSGSRQTNLGPVPITRSLVGNLKYIVRAGNVDFGGRYLLATLSLAAENAPPVISVEILGGGRYNYYNQYLRLGLNILDIGPEQSRFRTRDFVNTISRSYVEPFLGMRFGLWLNHKAVVVFRGTVGGFALFNDNNLDSDLELSFGYRVHKNIYAYLGYRARYEQFHTNQLDFSVWLHGPILGAVFAF